MKERLNAYTVTIMEDGTKYSFDKSCMNDKDNRACNNKAVKGAIEYLESLNPDQMIGILIVRQDMIKNMYSNTYTGAGLHNTYSHIYHDRSNWVTVAEALNFLKNM